MLLPTLLCLLTLRFSAGHPVERAVLAQAPLVDSGAATDLEPLQLLAPLVVPAPWKAPPVGPPPSREAHGFCPDRPREVDRSGRDGSPR